MTDDTFLLGLDLGTSTVKVGLYTLDGREVAVAGDEYLVIAEGAARVDVDPELFWQGICRAVRQVLSGVRRAPERIAGVSMSSHAETLVFLDRAGRPVRPAIFTTDARAGAEAAELSAAFDPAWLLERTGQPEVVGILPAAKILWLARHEPEALAHTAHCLLPEDYILYRLSGAVTGETAEWGSSVMADLHTRDWLSPMLERIGMGRTQLPQLVSPGTPVGQVTSQAAAETGLRAGTPVVMGAMDQVCAAVAAGNIAPGMVTESTGSVLALVATISRPVFDPVTKISCYTHAVPGAYCLIPWNPAGGLVLKWFKDRFGEREQEQEQADGRSAYDLLCEQAAGVAPGCDGLTMLPHLQGVLFPEIDPAARGAFFGFTLAHTRAHFTRAILEAIAFMLRDGLEALRGLGVSVGEVCSLGGGAKSRLWSQIKADVCQVPLTVPVAPEAALQGAAMLAAVGAGCYPDVPSAARMMVRVADRVEPNPALAATYEAAYSRYQALYRQLKPLFYGGTPCLR